MTTLSEMKTRLGRCAAWAAVVLAVLLSTGAEPAVAQGMRHGWGRDGGLALPFLVRAVKLTPEQDARVREILSARRTAVRSTLEQLRQTQRELADKLLAPGEVQAAEIQPQLQQIAQLREQLLQGSAQAALDVRAILTPEQLARAAQVKARMQQLRGEMRQLFEPARP
ncbi:MAG: periplasmic heavy metal sensor [Candidatus Rokubacteria bacterium]|nr:periplasmic heavy metal sensor [Candidatus Rokubacteria bacterium]MBI3107102.1 periplasmic heavy metal sensor [Candidatus Rokubacteria bacterium]